MGDRDDQIILRDHVERLYRLERCMRIIAQQHPDVRSEMLAILEGKESS